MTRYSYARYLALIVQLYSYHFIANSNSYLNAAGFLESFSVPVKYHGLSPLIGSGGGWGAEGGVKHPFGLKEQCCAFSKYMN